MGRRRRHLRFLVEGKPLKCPDCEGTTPFSGGSLLGDLADATDVAEKVLSRLYRDCFAETVVCRRCRSRNDHLLWIEVMQGRLQGPLCGECFAEYVVHEMGGDRNVIEDHRVYHIRLDQKSWERLSDIYNFLGEEETKQVEVAGSETPINPRDLF